MFESKDLRLSILEMAFNGATAHIACAFSLVEILGTLYEKHLNYPNNDPASPDRDYLILSKGHGVMAQYACMYEKGWLSKQDLEMYFEDGTFLTGLADSRIPGIETTTGSLGHGLPVATGMALSAKLRKSNQKTFVVVGDGEMNEGSMWEAALFASQHELENLFVLVDENGLQAMGATHEILNLGSLLAKLESFGFDVLDVDGHNRMAIDNAITKLRSKNSKKPKALVCKTVKGKGVSFMENDNIWHYTRIDSAIFQQAKNEIVATKNA